ncbi:methyltransferase domain-containing protein [Aestuariicoccus sp. MJ-SS9]|uniref:methyltransferase domain-containing protein n=1 Tax=Aestuariicoccus sp. MJ-SS9 TaxID=3079855 RepID=UPI0029106D07|nr:methyltransferase domain-containing protein [Aestuariicoccus sp. MJ-SS9]MDU8911387.1 methyltransferase domain-containing protein [Aestuariicoccus sp. MJ-SS9]
MLAFDAETTRLLEASYQGADVGMRRRASFDAVDPRPGETILDIGCGNGLLTLELARAVGPGGHVIGIDPSADMRAAAVQRCADLDWAELIEGRSDALPLADGTADKAVSVQVFEYIPDHAPSLSEAFRVLRPGGRLTLSDVHFDSWVWFSDDPARMNRMKAAWDSHAAHVDAPARLPHAMTEAGFVVDRVVPHTTCDQVLKPDGLANLLIHLIKAYAVSEGLVPADEVEAWADEQTALAASGRFFFSLTQFVVSATRPV